MWTSCCAGRLATGIFYQRARADTRSLSRL
jgi:hypothetical protein